MSETRLPFVFVARRTPRAPRAIDLALSTAALGGTVGIAALIKPAAPGGAIVALALAFLALVIAFAALGRRAAGLLRRGILDRDALTLAAATAAFALGGCAIAAGDPGSAVGAAAATAGIVTAALAARSVEAALQRRARRLLNAGSGRDDKEIRAALARAGAAAEAPPDGSWDDAAVRGIVSAALGCAAFAIVTRGATSGAEGGPGAVASAVAVLVVASPAAILAAAPAARVFAILRAIEAGAIVRDPQALTALAAADVAFLDRDAEGAGDAVAGLGRRGLDSVVWGSHGPRDKAVALGDFQRRGARVAVVGDARAAARADVALSLRAGDGAPITLSGAGVQRLPALVDLGRALRAVLRQNAGIALIYNATAIPAAALGYVPPLAAAGISLLETLAVLANAARLSRGRALTPAS